MAITSRNIASGDDMNWLYSETVHVAPIVCPTEFDSGQYECTLVNRFIILIISCVGTGVSAEWASRILSKSGPSTKDAAGDRFGPRPRIDCVEIHEDERVRGTVGNIPLDPGDDSRPNAEP
jgi:hypothetical protein